MASVFQQFLKPEEVSFNVFLPPWQKAFVAQLNGSADLSLPQTQGWGGGASNPSPRGWLTGSPLTSTLAPNMEACSPGCFLPHPSSSLFPSYLFTPFLLFWHWHPSTFIPAFLFYFSSTPTPPSFPGVVSITQQPWDSTGYSVSLSLSFFICQGVGVIMCLSQNCEKDPTFRCSGDPRERGICRVKGDSASLAALHRRPWAWRRERGAQSCFRTALGWCLSKEQHILVYQEFSEPVTSHVWSPWQCFDGDRADNAAWPGNEETEDL